MPFCTNCGSRIEVESRFCVGCGKTIGNGTRKLAAMEAAPPAPPPAPTPAPEPLEYTIHGENVQVVGIRLKPGQEVIAEAGKMIYKFPEVRWESRMSGEAHGERLDESLYLTHFSATSPSEVGFAGAYPGRIQAFDLKAGQSMLVERDGFLCAQGTARLEIALVKKLGSGFFGGEGFILERLTGPGTVFIHAGGDFVEFVLNPSQVIQVDTGSIVAFDDSVRCNIQPAEGIKTALFGGEDLFLATLTGPGRVVMQSMTLEKMRRDLSPFHSGGDEGGAVLVRSGMFADEA